MHNDFIGRFLMDILEMGKVLYQKDVYVASLYFDSLLSLFHVSDMVD